MYGPRLTYCCQGSLSLYFVAYCRGTLLNESNLLWTVNGLNDFRACLNHLRNIRVLLLVRWNNEGSFCVILLRPYHLGFTCIQYPNTLVPLVSQTLDRFDTYANWYPRHQTFYRSDALIVCWIAADAAIEWLRVLRVKTSSGHCHLSVSGFMH